MQTGGYKGRSREVEPALLRGMLADRYGLDDANIVAEYGMTEMSSQLYEASLRDRVEGHPSPRHHLIAPPWVRATPVDPESLQPVQRGEVGVLRIDDAANLDSVASILTSDLAELMPDGSLVLHGRAEGSSLRGCSLAVEEALGHRPTGPWAPSHETPTRDFGAGELGELGGHPSRTTDFDTTGDSEDTHR